MNQKGQAMTEYILLIGIIAVGLTATLKIVNPLIKLTFQKAAYNLGIEFPGNSRMIELRKKYLETRLKLEEMKEDLAGIKDQAQEEIEQAKAEISGLRDAADEATNSFASAAVETGKSAAGELSGFNAAAGQVDGMLEDAGDIEAAKGQFDENIDAGKLYKKALKKEAIKYGKDKLKEEKDKAIQGAKEQLVEVMQKKVTNKFSGGLSGFSEVGKDLSQAGNDLRQMGEDVVESVEQLVEDKAEDLSRYREEAQNKSKQIVNNVSDNAKQTTDKYKPVGKDLQNQASGKINQLQNLNLNSKLTENKKQKSQAAKSKAGENKP